MTYEEEQALNFRKVLGLDGDETKSSEPEAAPVNEGQPQTEQTAVTTRVKKGKYGLASRPLSVLNSSRNILAHIRKSTLTFKFI